MAEFVEIRIVPELVEDQLAWRKKAAKKLGIKALEIDQVDLIKRSIDARGRAPVYQLRLKVWLEGEKKENDLKSYVYHQVADGKEVVIIGAGPCGYFAALRCIELGLRPIVLERGKDVQSRRRDLRQIQQFHTVNPDSNYCFGEGGAGTYSDGKLYTRSVKRGNVRKILEVLVQHGAASDILIDAHPHIGSNKLPKIVAQLRSSIESSGGRILFNSRVTDFKILKGRIIGVELENGTEIRGDAFVLCTGHSARDIYAICQNRGVNLEFKPFAMGMRLEHPQPLIDQIQYKRKHRGDHLPAASYSLSCQVDDRGVFSFCMCPGGLIVPAATSPGEIVVNGMSLSRRDSPYANAATVVAINENPDATGHPFGGMHYQERLEKAIFNYGDGSQRAPAQRMTDFLDNKVSQSLPDCSYIPGIYTAPLHQLLPEEIVTRIKRGVRVFGQRMKGYLTEEAQFVGLESRTSAPIRIPRDKEYLMSPDIEGLFPAGEGAGYAGGILSAALDGERIADAVRTYVTKK